MAPPADSTLDMPRQAAANARLSRSLWRPRTLLSQALSIIAAGLTLFALFPLFAVIWMLLRRGLETLSWTVLTSKGVGPGLDDGGIGFAIVGTLVMVGLAALISVPTGILAAVFLGEIGANSRAAAIIHFATKVLTGVPSILAGVFAYTVIVVTTTNRFSAIAGAVALAVLMLPVVVLTAEEAIRSVPRAMREAALGMGATRTQLVLRVVLPTALPGILTGVMLATARAAGETAPLLLTAGWALNFIEPTPEALTSHSTGSMAVLIYRFSSSPFEEEQQLAWAASLVLVLMVLVLNVVAQYLARPRHGRH